MSTAPASSGACGFCDIINGRVESIVVLEDEYAIAFLDKRPLFPGHSLLVPREHYETLIDLPDELISPFFADARLLAQAMETGLEAQGSFVALNNRVSQSVPHLHVHVVPRRRKDGLRGFFWPRQKYRDTEHAEHTAELLRSAIADLRS